LSLAGQCIAADTPPEFHRTARRKQPKPADWIDMKRTYQASKVRRARTHGFLVRMKTRGGRAVINARRAKGRKRLAV
jgi:large subunit ribosomal protein L34